MGIFDHFQLVTVDDKQCMHNDNVYKHFAPNQLFSPFLMFILSKTKQTKKNKTKLLAPEKGIYSV